MTITESQRFALHSKLKSNLGDDMGTLLMEHLPPSGWSDVAQKSDLLALERRFDGVDKRFDSLESQIKEIRSMVNLIVATLVTSVVGLTTLIVAIGFTR